MKKLGNRKWVITISSHKQCRQTIDFLNKNEIDYYEQNVMKEPLSVEEIQYLFSRVSYLEKIMSTKSKSYKQLEKLLENEENVKMSDIYRFIQENPKVLKYPIILDRERLMVGYHEHNIRTFLPRKIKHQYFYKTLEMEKRQEVFAL